MVPPMKADVLVIDDESVVTDAAVKILALESLRVDVAEDVRTAIARISSGYYPIIVCDVMMPDGNGFDILQALNERNIDSVVILMTGFSTVEIAVDAFSRGSTDFIPKPFTADELLDAVFRARNIHRLQERQRESGRMKQPDEIPFVPCPPKYHRLGHSSWMSPGQEGLVFLGACDIFLKSIESVREIELLGENEELIQGISGTVFVSSDGRRHKLPLPLSGRIARVNEALRKTPQLIEKDPYFEGWLYGLIPANLDDEMKHLIPCCSDRS